MQEGRDQLKWPWVNCEVDWKGAERGGVPQSDGDRLDFP